MAKKTYVVFEIGASAVKRITVDFDDAALIWHDAELIEIQTAEDPSKSDLPGAIKLLSTNLPPTAERVYSFNSPQIFVKNFFLPKIPLRELDEAVQIQVKKEVPFAADDTRVDYQAFAERQAGEKDRLRVLASAVSAKTLNQELSACRQAGFEHQTVVHTPFTIRRSGSVLGVPPEPVTAFLDIGYSVTEINLYMGNELKFARKIPLGVKNIFELFRDPMALERMGLAGVDMKRVDEILHKRGLLGEHEMDATIEGFKPMQFISTARPVLERFQTEITRTFNYFSEEYRGKSVSRVYIFGGGSLVKGLPEFLGKRLQIPVVPFRISGGSEAVQVSGKVKDKPAIARYGRMFVTLASRFEEHHLESFLSAQTAKAVLPIATAAVAFLFVIMGTKLSILGKEISVLEKHRAKIAGQYENAKTIKELENQQQLRESRLNTFFENEPYWEDVFKELSNIVPENFNIDSVIMNAGQMTLSGTYTQAKGSNDNLSAFLLSLQRGVFKSSKLLSTRETERGAGKYRFEVLCEI